MEMAKKAKKKLKKSYKEAVQQRKEKYKDWRLEQHVARGQEYPIELTLKEAGLGKI